MVDAQAEETIADLSHERMKLEALLWCAKDRIIEDNFDDFVRRLRKDVFDSWKASSAFAQSNVASDIRRLFARLVQTKPKHVGNLCQLRDFVLWEMLGETGDTFE